MVQYWKLDLQIVVIFPKQDRYSGFLLQLQLASDKMADKMTKIIPALCASPNRPKVKKMNFSAYRITGRNEFCRKTEITFFITGIYSCPVAYGFIPLKLYVHFLASYILYFPGNFQILSMDFLASVEKWALAPSSWGY